MNKTTDQIMEWTGLHGSEAKTQVEIYDDMIFGGRQIVILTEPDDNAGTSVTNGIETVVATAIAEFEICPINATFIEHYPQRGDRGTRFDETFDVVTFGFIDKHGIPRRPVWRPIVRAIISAHIGTTDWNE